MNLKSLIYRILAYTIFSIIPLQFGCNSERSIKKVDRQICVVLAHPDDETIISGTLAMLSSKGCRIAMIYVTSGDGGADETGQGLHGETLAEVREQESQRALQAIGIKTSPIFLKYPDSYVSDHVEDIKEALCNLFKEIEPDVVISFGPDGITNHRDHKMTGFATDLAFDLTDSGRLLLHMAHTKSLIPLSANDMDVSRQAIDLTVDVSDFTDAKVQCFQAHHTQFPQSARSAYKVLVNVRKKEEFIIARNRNAELLIQQCFDLSLHNTNLQE